MQIHLVFRPVQVWLYDCCVTKWIFFFECSRSIKSFYQALYVDPAFSRANEIHLRLGLIFKQNKNFAAALKHFNCALNDQAECSKSKLQIKFYVAHLHESQGKYAKAKELYLRLVDDPSLPLDVKADTYRWSSKLAKHQLCKSHFSQYMPKGFFFLFLCL